MAVVWPEVPMLERKLDIGVCRVNAFGKNAGLKRGAGLKCGAGLKRGAGLELGRRWG